MRRLLVLLALTGCTTTPPPIVSGDTYCVRAKFIVATDAQAKAMLADEQTWRSLVEQIADHNDEWKAARCSDATNPGA